MLVGIEALSKTVETIKPDQVVKPENIFGKRIGELQNPHKLGDEISKVFNENTQLREQYNKALESGSKVQEAQVRGRVMEKVIENVCPEYFDNIKAQLINRSELPDGQLKTEKDIQGGSYRDVKKATDSKESSEVHHIPSKSSYDNIHHNDGPAIKMDAQDHKETASYGYSNESRQYQKEQEGLMSEGKFKEAIQMDIDDIRSKFGSKYDDAIEQALQYANNKGYI